MISDVGAMPTAVLVISAHWEESQFTVQTNPKPPMLYDYYGFPPNTYELQYPAPGSPILAARVKELLTKNGIKVKEDSKRGFDHGVFVPLLLALPKADVPVIQLSLKKGLDPEEHYKLGQALAPLRDEGVLIIGSGSSYHNLGELHDMTGASDAFDEYLTDAVSDSNPESRHEKLVAWESAPHARDAHPREEHLAPVFVAAGAAGGDAGKRMYTEKMKFYNYRASSFQFGELRKEAKSEV